MAREKKTNRKVGVSKEREIKKRMRDTLGTVIRAKTLELVERWTPVIQFEGLYEVSSFGRIRRTAKGSSTFIGKVLRPSGKPPKVWLRKDGRYHMRQVHLLVINSFEGGPEGDLKLECRHLDGNNCNSRLDNLLYGTHLENESDKFIHGTLPRGSSHYRARFVDDDIRWIRALSDLKLPQRVIASMFKTTQATISKITLRVRWEHVEDYLP